MLENRVWMIFKEFNVKFLPFFLSIRALVQTSQGVWITFSARVFPISGVGGGNYWLWWCCCWLLTETLSLRGGGGGRKEEEEEEEEGE